MYAAATATFTLLLCGQPTLRLSAYSVDTRNLYFCLGGSTIVNTKLDVSKINYLAH